MHPPSSDFSLCCFYSLVKFAIRSIYVPFVRIPMYLLQDKSKNFLPWNKLEGDGLQQPLASLEKERIAAKINEFA